MLAMSDTPIAQFIPYFAKASVPVAFLVPTPTGYEKSIMDATAPIRQLLFDAQVHDYEAQEQGPSNKVLIPAHFVNYSDVTSGVYVTRQQKIENFPGFLSLQKAFTKTTSSGKHIYKGWHIKPSAVILYNIIVSNCEKVQAFSAFFDIFYGSQYTSIF